MGLAESANDALVGAEEGLTDRAIDAFGGAGDGTGVVLTDSNFSRFALVSAGEGAGEGFAEANDAFDNAGDGLTDDAAASCLIDLDKGAYDGAGDGTGVASFTSEALDSADVAFGVLPFANEA